jgi:hypothetical protein
MTSASIAALVAVFALGIVEGLRRFYPARDTWWRLRRQHGRRAVRAMRERFEAAAGKRSPRVLAGVLALLVIAWTAASSLLDKHWYEVALDSLPYAFVAIALLRIPGSFREMAERMKEFERDAGEDPDADIDDQGGGPSAVAL